MAVERDVRLSFDQVPEIYDRVRPSYPKPLFDTLFAALPSAPQIVEVGPGTGQATADLLARGAAVTAVEIGPHLAERLAQNFVGTDALTVINASFEEAELASHGCDAVVCATAYHWIGTEAQVARPLEILRPGGVAGIIDLIQVESPRDGGYFDAAQPIYQRFGINNHNWSPPTHQTARPKIANHFEASGQYRSVDVHTWEWDQTYTSAKYRDLLLSYSGTQMLDEPDRTNLVDQLVGLIDSDFGGQLTRPLVAALTLATAP